jgi:predicted CoA-binding protein
VIKIEVQQWSGDDAQESVHSTRIQSIPGKVDILDIFKKPDEPQEGYKKKWIKEAEYDP